MHKDSKLLICLPLFGYEHFILKLAQRFPKRLKYSNLKEFYFNSLDEDFQMNENFLNDDSTDARIILKAGESTPYQAKR